MRRPAVYSSDAAPVRESARIVPQCTHPHAIVGRGCFDFCPDCGSIRAGAGRGALAGPWHSCKMPPDEDEREASLFLGRVEPTPGDGFEAWLHGRGQDTVCGACGRPEADCIADPCATMRGERD